MTMSLPPRMPRCMIFIDGTWMYSNLFRIRTEIGRSEYHVDFEKLPKVLAGVASQAVGQDLFLAKSCLFGCYPVNVDPIDEEAAKGRREFYEFLQEDFGFDIDIYPSDFRGMRLRKDERDGVSGPDEKYVDIAVASSMIYHAAVNAYDVAIAVLGDRDFVPALRTVRRFGKKVLLVSFRGSCASDYTDGLSSDNERIVDFDVAWINDLLEQLELVKSMRLVPCDSPLHKGDRMVKTNYIPKPGRKYFCKFCRAEFQKGRFKSGLVE